MRAAGKKRRNKEKPGEQLFRPEDLAFASRRNGMRSTEPDDLLQEIESRFRYRSPRSHRKPLSQIQRSTLRLLSQPRFKNVITAGIVALVAIGILFNWAVPVSAQNAAPATPDEPTLRALHKGMVEVDWSDVSGADRYEVQFYTSSGWTDMPNAGLGIEIFFYGSRAVATGLPEDLSYDAFHVRAGNSVGWSAWSEYAWQRTTHDMDWEGIPVPTIEPTPMPTNSTATGAPTISGIAQVGETLTVDTSGIADADGLDNAVFGYQWLADDGDISGATGKTHTLTEADEGKTVKVQVSFTDDEGNEETLTSTATDAVSMNPVNPAATIALSFLTATPAHVSQLEVAGIHVTADHVYLAANGGGLSSVWMFGGSAMSPEQYLPLDFEPRGLAASSAHLYVLDASGIAHAYDLETLSPDSSSDIRFALRGTDNPAASLRGVYALAAYDPGFTGPDSGMGLVYAARRIETGVDQWEVVGPPGVGVHHDELVQLGITDLDGSDVATDLSTYLFVENGDGDGAHVFEVQPSGSAELSHGPELYFGRSGHDGLYYDGSLLWTLDVHSYERDPNDGQTLTLHAFDPAQRTLLPDHLDDHLHDHLHESDIIGSCENDALDHVEDLDGLLLPDLVSCQHDYSVAEVVVAPDGTELHALRFAGFVTNLGDGPLDLKGNPQLADKADLTSHDVWQRALTVDGDWVNQTKPPIKFERVDGHGHFHLKGIVEYSLWDTSGTVEIRSSAKVGFCLIDVAERPDLHPNPGPERYKLWDPDIRFCKWGRPGAKNLRMGISEGWQDIYSFSATFQWIDVSNVRPGYYRVGQRVDPDNIIVESDETNNGLALSQRSHVVPGYVARPETVRVEPDATVRFKLSADEYLADTSVEDESTRAHRIVTQPSHGSLDVGDTVTIIVGGATHQVFNDEWVTYTPDPGYAGVDSFTFVALDESRPKYPINPVVAKVTLDISGLDATVTIDNAPTSIATGSSFDLDATVNGATNDVAWSVDGVEGGSDEAGTIDADGRYSAPVVPPVSGTVTVRAASTQAPAAYAEVVITVSSAVQQQTANNPATGSPTITGAAQVGEALTADISGIADEDGLSKVSYQYQWIRNDGTSDTEIASGTDSTYALADDDEGQTIQVRVTFTDDLGNETTLTSAATEAVAAAPPTDSPATGAPTISGTAQVGESLTADTSGIADADGLDSAVFGYQWVAGESDITDATDSTYTLVDDDEGRTIKVRVTVTDDLGNETTLTSAATEAVEAAPPTDSPATGEPTITGTVRVGEELTADTSGIADADGLNNAVFGYQWLSDDAESGGATGSTYTLADDDEGRTIKVRVTFTDDLGNETTLTSAATDAVAPPEPPDKPTGLSPVVAHDAVTLAWDDPQDDSITGYVILRRDREIHLAGTFVTIAGDTGSADTTYSDDTVEPDKQYVYRIKAINEHGEVSEKSDWIRADTPAVPVPDKPTGLSAAVSHDTVTLTWDNLQDDSITGYVILRRDRAIHPVGTFVTLTGDTGSAETTYTDDTVEPDKEYVYRIKAINEHRGVSEMSHWVRGFTPAAPPTDSPATGEPTITGTVRVGEELTADTSGIADADGLDSAVFGYQWLSDDAESGGAAGSTYTLVADDEGRTIKVRVTFTDDLGNETTLTSAATEAVAAAPPTDSPATGEPTITGTVRVGEELTADTSGIADADGLNNAVFGYQWVAGESDITDATDSTYTLVADDEGRTIKVRVTVTDDLGNETTLTSAATEAVAAAPPTDSPATGEPTITGTVRVGEELTADTSGIADADGLNNAVFGYQWVAGESDITDATDSTYTLVDDDEGRTIKVRVTFTDDLGNETTLTSAATEAVDAKRNTAATGRPTISGTVRVGETLTADTTGIGDADGLTNVSYSYQWVVTDGGAYIDISGETGATYTLVSADRGLYILVRVSFTDDAGKRETLTSAATEAVAAAA